MRCELGDDDGEACGKKASRLVVSRYNPNPEPFAVCDECAPKVHGLVTIGYVSSNDDSDGEDK
jgi:hypothetical protein